ncbi:G5 domain-containing protein [bacterium]|nr:G5 domain-containing protein [bacterium]
MRFTNLLALCFVALLLAAGLGVTASAAGDEKRIEVKLDNETIPLTSNAQTVEALLGELSIDAPSELAIDPPLDSALKDGMTVALPGLTVTRGVTERVVPAETQFVERRRVGEGACVIEESGQDGLLRTTCTIFYSQGQEVGRRQRDEVLRKMQPRVVAVYTPCKPEEYGPSVEQILEERAKPGTYTIPPQNYRKCVTMSSTAYEPGPRSCGRHADGKTSIGLIAGYGVVAIDPDVIPYGTRLFIEDYGYAVAGDTGGAINGRRIDLGFLTVKECLNWGRRKVKVYILD